MARKNQLRQQRAGTVINATSKQQETELVKALKHTASYLDEKFYGVEFHHEKLWRIVDIVGELERSHADVDFHHHFNNTSIKPDGGLLCLKAKEDDSLTFPVLISEVKNQGTNDQRRKEGLPRQARGNAIERLGKNVIGLRAALMRESIFPFVCFGYGCDFEEDSSILDRVTTIAMFGSLNKTYLHNGGTGDRFNRGSFYFRPDRWHVDEMAAVMKDIAERSVLYYFSKYGKRHFGRVK